MTRLVVDLGCLNHQGHPDSVKALRNRFKPDILWAFDPLLTVEKETFDGRTRVIYESKAAWVEDAVLQMAPAAANTTAMREKNGLGEWEGGAISVVGFDFAPWLQRRHGDGLDEIIVKMDIEGAEFLVLQHLIDTSTDSLISKLLVEWHDGVLVGDYAAQRERLLGVLACPVEDWE